MGADFVTQEFCSIEASFEVGWRLSMRGLTYAGDVDVAERKRHKQTWGRCNACINPTINMIGDGWLYDLIMLLRHGGK
jgi:hypothetical protein